MTSHAIRNRAPASLPGLRGRAKILTDDARDPACAVFVRAMRAAHCTQPQISAALGCSAALVAGWCIDHPIGLGRMLELAQKLPRLYGELVELLTEAAVVPPMPPPTLERGALGVQGEAGELATVVLRATADGVVDEQERRAIDGSCAGVIAAVRRTRCLLEVAK